MSFDPPHKDVVVNLVNMQFPSSRGLIHQRARAIPVPVSVPRLILLLNLTIVEHKDLIHSVAGEVVSNCYLNRFVSDDAWRGSNGWKNGRDPCNRTRLDSSPSR
jgi:hypothetical protein